MSDTTQESLSVVAAKSLIIGHWKNKYLQLRFYNTGFVYLCSISGNPGWQMNYYMYLLEGSIRIKMQDSHGEKNYAVARLDEQHMEIMDASGIALTFKKVTSRV